MEPDSTAPSKDYNHPSPSANNLTKGADTSPLMNNLTAGADSPPLDTTNGREFNSPYEIKSDLHKHQQLMESEGIQMSPDSRNLNMTSLSSPDDPEDTTFASMLLDITADMTRSNERTLQIQKDVNKSNGRMEFLFKKIGPMEKDISLLKSQMDVLKQILPWDPKAEIPEMYQVEQEIDKVLDKKLEEIKLSNLRPQAPTFSPPQSPPLTQNSRAGGLQSPPLSQTPDTPVPKEPDPHDSEVKEESEDVQED